MNEVIDKYYINANDLLKDSFQLAALIENSGYIPDLILGVWRGGSPIAIAIHEFFSFKGYEIEHFPVRVSSYTGISEQSNEIKVQGLAYLLEELIKPENTLQRILIVDDVFDSGRSLATLLLEIKSDYQQLCPTLALPEIRLACPWYKPENNKTDITPDYYLHLSEQWLVFPHELVGLSEKELKNNKEGLPLQAILTSDEQDR